MISVLMGDEIIHKIGGRFKLTALIQRRWLQIMQGSPPMVERGNLTDLELVIREIAEGKIEPIFTTDKSKIEDASA